ncbi:MAG: DNA replication/repair protein RecF [Ignavibacteria bacterium]|nr:DNA replication/repair protein RecF [Ignavibacteria bacterium]
MKIAKFQLENFRNHSHTVIACTDCANVFLGNNGAGKTNIVEGLAYLCVTKSFYAVNDLTALKVGESSFRISGELISDSGNEFSVQISYDGEAGEKRYLLNGKTTQKLSSIIGKFPIVILSPEYSGITFGSPTDRRKFLDFIISQASARYLEDVLEYRRILRQRNRILLDGKSSNGSVTHLLEPWSEGLIEYGSRVVQRRAEFVRDFEPYLSRAYEAIAGEFEKPNSKYLSAVASERLSDADGLRMEYRRLLEESKHEERRVGATLVGPHRDDLLFTLDRMELRRFGSQGQHRTFLIAMKIAEFEFLRALCGETPILILDDVFSELDGQRSGKLIETVSSMGQYFITTTDDRVFPQEFFTEAGNKHVVVKSGSIIREQAAA